MDPIAQPAAASGPLPTGFDFEHAVTAPFRMQPGLRRAAAGTPVLTPVAAGSRTQREKLAVLSAYAGDALLQRDGFDAGPALAALLAHAARAWPEHLRWDGERAQAPTLGLAVDILGRVDVDRAGVFGLGTELPRCLDGLSPPWRLAGLLSLVFAEDLAVVDGATGRLEWLAVCLPSFWAPVEKIGRRFAEVHAPVADGDLLRSAGDALMRLVTDAGPWERFVWTVTPHPRLHGHPARLDPRGWDLTPVSSAWWRTERQAFLPVAAPQGPQAVFTIRVDARPLAQALDTPERTRALKAALASQSAAVQAYRHLDAVMPALLAWLDDHADRLETPGRPMPGPPGA